MNEIKIENLISVFPEFLLDKNEVYTFYYKTDIFEIQIKVKKNTNGLILIIKKFSICIVNIELNNVSLILSDSEKKILTIRGG